MFKFYEVGGKVRDEILGLQSKDVDYVAVPKEELLATVEKAEDMFGILEEFLKEEKFEIFYAKEADQVRFVSEFKMGVNFAFPDEIVDFVLA